MAYIVRMSKLGLEMEEGTLLEWYVDKGDAVEAGDVIAEIESEKTQAEVEAREDGVLRRIYLQEGETCEPGEPIGIVAEADADIADIEATVEDALAGEPSATEEPTATEKSDAGEAVKTETGPPSAGDRTVKASPPARKRAEEEGIDLASIDGTGPDGAITPEDVERAAEGTSTDTGEGVPGLTLREERPMTGTRGTIADRLAESYRNAVHVTVKRTVDAEELRLAAEAVDDASDEDVSVVDVLLVALSRTLTDHPAFNARYEDETHRLYEEHNVCIAVDTDQGLLAPVMRDVADMGVSSIAAERASVTELVLERDHTMDDLTGGTFTITNLGPFGVEAFDPIINPPQVAILGINAIVKEPVVSDDDTVGVRHRLPLNLTFDHRLVDGADAARFLHTLGTYLEDPWSLVPGDVSTDDL
ncbi:MAG: dihydrolipoamide acetyltransferase family protein [Natronomonas sp.]